MRTSREITTLLASVAGLSCQVQAAPPMPNEFERTGDVLSPLFAYFGGVSAWGSTPSTATIHTGGSLEVWATLQPDWATFSGFAIGTFGISSPQLNLDPAADYFSVTIEAPTNGQLSFYVVVREDDNGDGEIDVNTFDDEWETPTVLLNPGVNAYNFAITDFVDVDPGAGNNIPGFTTTNRLAYFLVFETDNSYPGGHVNEPVSFLIDHAGFFVGPQQVPPLPRAADVDGDGIVGIQDFLAVLSAWGACAACPEDTDGDGLVGIEDFLAVLSDWG